MAIVPTDPRRLLAKPDFRLLIAADAIVFTSNMCILMLELVTARLVARYVGTSLYTWTSVIGVVLGGMCLGNYVGGWLADSFKPRRLLAWLFVAASALSLSILWTNGAMKMAARPEVVSWQLWILACVTMAVFWPACVLGAIAPVAAKLALDHAERSGLAFGNVYAWGTLGAIAGTFLAGFFLIGTIGTQGVVCAISAGLAAIGVLLHLGQSAWGFATACVVFLLVTAVSAPAAGHSTWARRMGLRLGVRDDELNETRFESNYYTIKVATLKDTPNTKQLVLDNLVHSYVPMDDPTRLEYEYEKIYASVTERFALPDRPLRAMFIGGGGFVFPLYLEARYPSCERIDVAEIDPMVKWTAQHELTLPPDGQTKVVTHLMDARNYVEDRRRQNAAADDPVLYDFIYGDAFNSFSVPYHLTTKEFNDRVSDLLQPRGIYLINIIDIYRPGLGQFLGAYVNTARQTFPNVYVFSSSRPGPTYERDTFVIVCSKQPLGLADPESDGAGEEEGTLFAAAEGDRPLGDIQMVLARGQGIVLTDDYAPVDNLLAPVFRER